MTQLRWRTLPLFEDCPASVEAPGRPAPPPDRIVLDQILHVYWSAGVEAHVLAALARKTPFPDERDALLQLLRLDEQRKALAAKFLETIWRVSLPSSGAAAPAPDGEEDSASAA